MPMVGRPDGGKVGVIKIVLVLFEGCFFNISLPL
jgi:hypothetical protein